MSRDLSFDGWWEGDAAYYCDCCQKEAPESFRFDSEEINSKEHRAVLREKHGWIVTKVNNKWYDFCSERCRNIFIRNNTK